MPFRNTRRAPPSDDHLKRLMSEFVVEVAHSANLARTGIGLVPFPEADANDVPPASSAWADPCSAHHVPGTGVPESKCQKISIIGPGCVVLWDAQDNKIQDNTISNSGLVDMGEATIDLTNSGVTTEKLGNCFSGNTETTTSPVECRGARAVRAVSRRRPTGRRTRWISSS